MRSFPLKMIALVLLAFSVTSCHKDCVDDKNIVVSAGSNQFVYLPLDTAKLTGTVISGLTPNTTYDWIFISGPNVPVLHNGSSAIASAVNLVAGTYVFQFQATNSYGHTGIDTTTVIVLPPSAGTLVLQPANNPNEAVVNIHTPTTWIVGSGQFYIEAWTIFGDPFIGRVALKFDYSTLPAGAVIDNALLYLYSDPSPVNGDMIHAQSGPTNAFYIKRITSNWVMPNPFTWNSQPAASTTNQVLVPQSGSSTESATANVTELVKDQQTFGNNGFFMVLQNEVTYNTRQYASSYNADAALHPKLVIAYH